MCYFKCPKIGPVKLPLLEIIRTDQINFKCFLFCQLLGLTDCIGGSTSNEFVSHNTFDRRRSHGQAKGDVNRDDGRMQR